MIDASIHLGDPADIALEEVIPGEPRPVRAVLALPDERVGVLTGHLPATRSWDAADQDLLELYASEIAVAIRNAELFEQVERADRAARRARRRQGRLPARHQPQPPDAADEHPGLRRAARGRAAGPPAGDHHRAVGAPVADGPPAPRGLAARGGHAPAPSRGARPRARGSGTPGMRSAPPTSRSSSTTRPRAGWRSPTATSSTRSSGPSSTTPSSTAPGRPSGPTCGRSSPRASCC